MAKIPYEFPTTSSDQLGVTRCLTVLTLWNAAGRRQSHCPFVRNTICNRSAISKKKEEGAVEQAVFCVTHQKKQMTAVLIGTETRESLIRG